MTTIQKIIDKARAENRTFLLEPESKRIIKELGIPTTDFAVAKSADEVKSVAKKV
ncbi:MAG: acetate--CoA ligase family protein, partial [Candidatus Heimdallarchaeota archaeon]